VRIELGLRTVAATAAFLVCTSDGAIGQVKSEKSQYPTNDIAVTLSSGTTVRIRNVVVLRTPNGSGLAVYIQTPTPATEPERLALEAKEVAGVQLKSPTSENITRVRVVVCRTQGCLEMRESPQEMFLFVRNPDGSLQAQERPDSPTTAAVSVDAPLVRIISLFVGERRDPVCGSEPPQGGFIAVEGGDYCEWMTPTRGRIVAQRDEQHRVQLVTMERQTNSEAHARAILDSLATTLRSFGFSERQCAPESSPAGAIRSWLYEGGGDLLAHISEITPPAGPPRLLAVAVDVPGAFPRVLCH